MIDSILFVSFGGPEGPEDVMPFLENVLRGKNVPRERMVEVAQHYMRFGGVSPINAQNRDIIARLDASLKAAAIDLPIYWGNRNWKPTIEDALRTMQLEGRTEALPVFTNMFSSYSGCRQYLQNIDAAKAAIGLTSPSVVPRLRFGFNHPRFLAAQVDLVREAWNCVPEGQRNQGRILFSAHSIPLAMAERCMYVAQLTEAARLIVDSLRADPTMSELFASSHEQPWDLVFQSRSGPPSQPWLEPDILDCLESLGASGVTSTVVVPLGFVSDHLEVQYDLDIEARELCGQLGIAYSRAASVSNHPEFIAMLVDLIRERLVPHSPKDHLGNLPPLHDACPADCCH